MSEYLVSAVICTYNRAEYLRKSLRSLISQSLPKHQYEIVVVDNGSLDSTGDIVLETQAREPNVRYFIERTLGLSAARNTGWINSISSIVAYLDDDAIASYHWLETLVRAFNCLSSTIGCVGGRITPKWEAPRPAWLPDELIYLVGNLDLPGGPQKINGPSWLGGGNSAYRRSVLAAIGGFDTRVGRKGTNLLSMEDTLIQKRIIKLGFEVYYDPEALIQHCVPVDRLKVSWFLRRSYWEGVSSCLADDSSEVLEPVQALPKAFRALASIPLRMIIMIARLLQGNKNRVVLQLCVICNRAGLIQGIIKRLLSGVSALRRFKWVRAVGFED